MDTSQFIPQTTAGEQQDHSDPRAPCDCTQSFPAFESAKGSKWWIMTPCGHVKYLITARVIPYSGVTEASGLEAQRIIREFARNHPHLPKTDTMTAVSGLTPAAMTPEAYPRL